MNKKSGIILCVLAVVFFAFNLNVFSEPTKEDCLKAWEEIKRNNPDITLFEKIAENQYKIKSDIIPIDLIIEVFKIEMRNYENYITANVLFDIINPSQEEMAKYSKRTNFFYDGDHLYYSKEKNKWMTTKEWHANESTKMHPRPYSQIIFLVVGILVTLGLLGFLVWGGVIYPISIVKRGIAIEEETNSLLSKILEVLKNQK